MSLIVNLKKAKLRKQIRDLPFILQNLYLYQNELQICEGKTNNLPYFVMGGVATENRLLEYCNDLVLVLKPIRKIVFLK